MKVPKKQPKRGRLWLNDGSCIRLRPEHKDHVWSYDFVIARTADGRSFRVLNIIDEYTRECLAILVKRHITSQDVIDQLFELIIFRGIPEHIRADNGPEFTAKAIRGWLNSLGVKTLFIEPGSTWENGYIDNSSFTYSPLIGDLIYLFEDSPLVWIPVMLGSHVPEAAIHSWRSSDGSQDFKIDLFLFELSAQASHTSQAR